MRTRSVCHVHLALPRLAPDWKYWSLAVTLLFAPNPH
jgi:hypothetical protein